MTESQRIQTGGTRSPRSRVSGSKAGRVERAAAELALDTRTPRAAPLLPFRSGRGGARPGAGRKPKIPGRPGVDHRERAPLAKRFPVHVTLKLRSGLPRLRSRREYAALRAAFAAGCARNLAGTFRLCHYAVLNDHLHLLCEAESRTALSRGLQGLLIRIAKALNKLWSRRGSVFADRYHDHILKSPREVRNALRYLFGNGKKHAAEGREVRVPRPSTRSPRRRGSRLPRTHHGRRHRGDRAAGDRRAHLVAHRGLAAARADQRARGAQHRLSLYAIPAGAWNDATHHGEWIRDTARIPLGDYDRLQPQWNPTAFDADAWARLAKAAGMKYLVVTSKHHDGFCLYDEPLHRMERRQDPEWHRRARRAGEGVRAARRALLHLPLDHGLAPPGLPAAAPVGKRGSRSRRRRLPPLRELPARAGHRDRRSATSPAVMWFDGEWESTWNARARAAPVRCAARFRRRCWSTTASTCTAAAWAASRSADGASATSHTPEQEIPADRPARRRLGVVHDDERPLGLQRKPTRTGSRPRCCCAT
jgi:putative transposase